MCIRDSFDTDRFDFHYIHSIVVRGKQRTTPAYPAYPGTRKWDSLWISDIGTNGARYRPDLQTPSALLPDDRLCPTHHDRFDLSDIPHFHNGIYPADFK